MDTREGHIDAATREGLQRWAHDSHMTPQDLAAWMHRGDHEDTALINCVRRAWRHQNGKSH
jgi:hypothetical protein